MIIMSLGKQKKSKMAALFVRAVTFAILPRPMTSIRLHCCHVLCLTKTFNDWKVCIAINFAFYQEHLMTVTSALLSLLHFTKNIKMSEKICIDVTFVFYQDFKCQESLSSVENSCVFKIISSVESRGCSKSYIQQSCSTRTRTRTRTQTRTHTQFLYLYPYPGTKSGTRTHKTGTRVPTLVPVPVPGYPYSDPYPYPYPCGTHTWNPNPIPKYLFGYLPILCCKCPYPLQFHVGLYRY